jgi:hypothetical protein
MMQRLWRTFAPQALFVTLVRGHDVLRIHFFPITGFVSDPQTDDTDREFFLCPAPLNCRDLTETFRTDTAAAFRPLMTLTPTQLNLQALAYAAYLNQRHGLNLDMDDILAGWQRHIEHAQHTT